MNNFAVDVRKFVEHANGNVDKVVRKVLFDLTTSIVKRTPVDTGRLRGNWQFGIGQPAAGTLNVLDAQGTGAGILASIGGASKVAGTVCYISNNLPYAMPIEYGHSRQAPQGMVRVSVMLFQQFVKKAVEDLK